MGGFGERGKEGNVTSRALIHRVKGDYIEYTREWKKDAVWFGRLVI